MAEDIVLEGHPEDGKPLVEETKKKEDKTTELAKEITINGKKLTVTPEAAALIEAQQNEFQEYKSTSQLQYEALQRRIDGLATAPKPEAKEEPLTPPDPLSETYEQDFKNYIEKYTEKIVSKSEETIRNDYQSEKAIESMWNEFYKDNEQLDRETDHLIVEALMNKHWDEVSMLPRKQALKEIGDKVTKYIVTYKEPKKNKNETPKVVVEGDGNNREEKKEDKPNPEKQMGMAAIAKMRKKQRREGKLASK